MPTSSAAAPSRPIHGVAQPLDAVASHLRLPPAVGADQVAVSGVSHSSSQVQPGDLYVAVQGQRTHGARFAPDAIGRGAVAVLTDAGGAALVGGADVPVLVVDDPRAVLGEAAAFIYGFPARDMATVGVTGTNGKTTVTTLLHAVLRAHLGPAGLVGTIETRVGDESFPSVRTTPEASDLHALLAVMRERGVRSAALEVSSHALALGRVGGLVVDVAGFTNLSQDHLDFHPDMEHYFAAKASLFTPQRARRGIVIVDDAWGRRLAEQASVPVRTLAVTPDDATDPVVASVDWRVVDVTAAGGGSHAVLLDPGRTPHDLTVPLPGLVNVANAALAVVVAAELGIDPDQAAAAVASAPMVPGRMELVSGRTRPVVVVDYAHSPDAIENALSSLRATEPSPLVVVIGAGGDRDPGKRAPMGAAAARGADLVVVTDDNPRSEDPAHIRSAVLAGARSVDPDRVVEVPDRAEAIEFAVVHAGGGTVLVAGKGHEQGQEVAGVVHPFDDRVVARSVLSRLAPSRPDGSEDAP